MRKRRKLSKHTPQSW
jgi:Golgi SNAP receptor complex protein 2